MECSGSKVALEQALEMTRSGGRIVLIGLFKNPVAIDFNRIIHKQLSLISSFSNGKLSKSEETMQTIGLISSGKVKTKPLISHEFPLDQINQAFEIQTKADKSVKVIVKP
jgi:threonine dehydrogenase-like Zn-dependent dehydrogenase